MVNFFRSIILVFWFVATAHVYGQVSGMSKNTQVINGKKYYIHKVEKGQSLYGIAKIYGQDLNTLIVENPEAIDGIKSGQELKIPAEKSKEQSQPTLKDYENYLTHKVSKGETVYSICHQYKISEQQLTQLNPTLKDGLKENSILKIKEKEKEKEKEKAKTTQTNTVNTSKAITNTVATTPKKTETEAETPIELISKPKKNRYNVGLFLPFHFEGLDALNIDELVMNKQDFPESQQLALDIYEGLKTAADSIKTDDFSIEFMLYDSGDIDSLVIVKLIKTEEFKNLDLIIGPLYNSPFKIVSAEAKKYQIPCVSPLTQQNKVLFDNVFTSKLIPSNNTLLQGLADYCADSLSKQNIVLVNNGNIKDLQNIKAFKSYYNQKVKDTLTEVKGVVGAKAVYKTDKINYYIILTENEAFISEFLTQLNIFADKKENLCVIGMRKWLNYDNLDLEYFNRFSFTCAAPYFVDEQKSFVQKLSTTYIQQYNTNTSDYYYLAADAGLYYFSLLKQTGNAFSVVLDDLPKKGTCINFNFTHPNNSTGFENQAVQIIRYNDYKLKKVN
ncbi:MAG TPA: LysM peptidoglycan-binding domain-containing protein [Bacteroidia bacterium]|nr:LysM peptidoglycan-binding domain-containing protein [Bacteroidia bacterium]